MAEKVKKYNNLIKVVHTLECDNCGREMTPNLEVLTTWPEQYSYHCSSCGSYTRSFTLYPYTEYIGDLMEEEYV